jgi:predicted aspartyl protease
MIKEKHIALDLDMVPIEEDGVHLFISGRINGKKARFLIDTGASRSVLARERIDRFFSGEDISLEKVEKLSAGLGTNTMESNTLILPLISLGRIRRKGYHVVVLELSHVNESYKQLGIKQIDGVIGGDLLLAFNAVIDYGNQSIRISRH